MVKSKLVLLFTAVFQLPHLEATFPEWLFLEGRAALEGVGKVP
jgi:hypothetical protein